MSFDSYSIATLLGLGRLILGIGVLSGLAWWLFPLRTAAPASPGLAERWWGQALLVLALVTLLSQGLALLGVFDGLMLAGCLLLLAMLRLWTRHRGPSGMAFYVRFLAWIERPRSLKSVVGSLYRRVSSRSTLLGLLLGGLVAGSATLRLLPLLSSPAPVSLDYYRLLEVAKHHQANDLFPGALLEARGLHSLTVSLHALTGVEMGLVVRLLGVLAVLFLVLGLYGATRSLTGDVGAALGAAGLFGLGLPFLPLALENQVAASPVLLATAYALPTWYFLLRYQAGGSRSHLWIGAAGLGLLLLTNGSVAALMMGILAGMGLTLSVFARRSARPRRALLVSALALGGGLLLGGLAVLRRGLLLDPFAVPIFSVTGAGLSLYPPDLSLPVYGQIVGFTALGLLASTLADRPSFRRLASGALAGTGLLLYAAWLALDALPQVDLAPMAPPALLSIFLAAGLGVLLARAADLVRVLLQRLTAGAALRPLYFGTMSGLLLMGIAAAPQHVGPTLEPAPEPAGYVRSLHAIQEAVPPYQWTVVSHHGTAVRVMNRGRFLSYDYFLHHYDAHTYDPAAEGAIPTTEVFLFVPTDATASLVRDELLASPRETTALLQRWCDAYQRRTGALSTFYADEHLTVYRLSRPQQPSSGSPAPPFRPHSSSLRP